MKRAGPLLLLATLALGAPLVKTLSLLNDWSPLTRQPLAVVATVGAAAVVLGKKVTRAVGVVPLKGWPPMHKEHLLRLAAGAGAALFAVSATQVEGRVRIGAVVAAAVLLTALLVAERLRQRWPAAGGGAAVAWAVTPVTLAACLSASVLAVQERAGGLGRNELLELALVTALGEELAFRGGLLALAYRWLSPLAAETLTAVSFGLWHVGNALDDSAGEAGLVRAAAVVATVAFTTLGGYVFSWMRHRTGTLAGPVLTHISTNLPGLALG